MSKIIEFPNREKVYEQASQWIAKLDRGLSVDEEIELSKWIRKRSEHKQVLFEMAGLWDKMDSLARLADLFDAPQKRASNYRSRAYFAVAASLMMVVAIAWGAFEFQAHNSRLIDGVYETAIGEHSTVNLPDGSQLVLNTNSRIQVQYSSRHRLFLLERGEINIDVAHDEDRPLSVLAGNKVVQAVGTAFNVKINNASEVELIVTNGKVRVEHRRKDAQQLTEFVAERLPDSALAISRGEKIVLGAQEEKISHVEDADLNVRLSWRQGNLIFRGETLEQALTEISRYTSIKFQVMDEKIKHERIAGLFKAGDVTGLLTALRQNFNIESEQLDNTVILSAR